MTNTALVCWVACAFLTCGTGIAGERERPGEVARSCPRYGPGFIEVPGTSTCIRVGGRLKAEYGIATRRVVRERVDFGGGGQASVDTRTDTAYGPLRSYVRVRAGQDTRR